MHDNNEIIRLVFGSHLYGTNTEQSDKDYKGVGLPTKEQVMDNAVPKVVYQHSTGFSHQKNTQNDVDVEIYSIHYFIKLALEGQTVALDMLHAPKEYWCNISDHTKQREIWEFLVEKRSMFYTKNLNSFIAYCRKQAAKYGLKGSRLSDCQNVIEWLKLSIAFYGERTKLKDVDLSHFPKGEFIRWNDSPDANKVHIDQQIIPSVSICEKQFGITTPLNFILAPLQKYYDQYGQRAVQAKENGGIDWKAISHAFRAAYQVREIFTEGTITFPLKESQYLKNIKLGKYDYNFIGPELDDLVAEIEGLSIKADLPEEPNYFFWESFINEIDHDILQDKL